jgi:hypothetical protein
LVELVPYNLATWSQDFSNANWVKSSSSVVSNSTTAPDGTLTADTQIVSAQFGGFNQYIDNLSTGSTYSISFWAKKLTGTNTYSVIDNSGGSGIIGTFTPTTEWVRYTFSFTAASSAMTLFPAQDRNASGFGSIYIWGAQLNEGTLKDYQRTETRLNIPRLDYSNGSCPSLLVEPQRTNLLLRSEEFDSISWIKDVGVSVNANFATSPSGIQNADKVNFASNNLAIYRVGTAVGAHRFSVYLKGEGANIGKQIQLIIGNVGGTTNVTLTDQWVRYETDATSATYTGVGKVGLTQADSVLIWGAQLEAGSYPTSYIPTTSASVTRNDDFISKTSATSLIGQTEGTIFVDFYNDGNTIYNPFSISDGYYGDAIYFEQFLGQMYGVIWDGGSQQFSFNAGALSIGNHRMAIAYKTNDIAFYIDGVLKATDSSATIPTCSRIDVGYLASATVYKTFINAAALWKERLTNEQLAQLTTI